MSLGRHFRHLLLDHGDAVSVPVHKDNKPEILQLQRESKSATRFLSTYRAAKRWFLCLNPKRVGQPSAQTHIVLAIPLINYKAGDKLMCNYTLNEHLAPTPPRNKSHCMRPLKTRIFHVGWVWCKNGCYPSGLTMGAHI